MFELVRRGFSSTSCSSLATALTPSGRPVITLASSLISLSLTHNIKMPRLTFLAGVVLVSLGLVPLMTTSRAADISTSQSSLERRYSTSHSLGESYQFHPRDGWEAVNITNLQYKYSRSLADDLGDLDGPTIPRAHTKRTSKKVSKESTKKTPKAALKAAKTISTANSAGIGLLGSVKAVVDSMKAMGESEPVTITWYTGHDLLNPSCWSTTSWTPTVRLGPRSLAPASR